MTDESPRDNNTLMREMYADVKVIRAKVEALESCQREVQTRVTVLEGRQDNIEGGLDAAKWLVGIGMAVMTIVLATANVVAGLIARYGA